MKKEARVYKRTQDIPQRWIKLHTGVHVEEHNLNYSRSDRLEALLPANRVQYVIGNAHNDGDERYGLLPPLGNQPYRRGQLICG